MLVSSASPFSLLVGCVGGAGCVGGSGGSGGGWRGDVGSRTDVAKDCFVLTARHRVDELIAIDLGVAVRVKVVEDPHLVQNRLGVNREGSRLKPHLHLGALPPPCSPWARTHSPAPAPPWGSWRVT